ncbi:MAG TPA: hypothetical protein VIG57_19425, partial [Candidatus Entotheonella sp.]
IEAESAADLEPGGEPAGRYLYNHYNHLTVVDLDLPYATNKRVAKWALGGAVWDQNFVYLIRP